MGSLKSMSVTELPDSVSGPFSLSLKVNFKKGKREGTTRGMLQTPLWGMEVQGRTGKISKWICTVAWSTSLYILCMEKQLSSRRAAIYAFIIHCKRSEFLNGNCTQITQGNISKMEKDLKGLISKTDYLIYMLLGLSVQIITGKIEFIYFPYIWHIFFCQRQLPLRSWKIIQVIIMWDSTNTTQIRINMQLTRKASSIYLSQAKLALTTPSNF